MGGIANECHARALEHAGGAAASSSTVMLLPSCSRVPCCQHHGQPVAVLWRGEGASLGGRKLAHDGLRHQLPPVGLREGLFKYLVQGLPVSHVPDWVVWQGDEVGGPALHRVLDRQQAQAQGRAAWGGGQGRQGVCGHRAAVA